MYSRARRGTREDCTAFPTRNSEGRYTELQEDTPSHYSERYHGRTRNGLRLTLGQHEVKGHMTRCVSSSSSWSCVHSVTGLGLTGLQ